MIDHMTPLLHAGKFYMTFCRLPNFSKTSNLKPDQIQCFVGPDLGPNCLQKLSADSTDRQRIDIASNTPDIGPDKDHFCTLNCIYFLTHLFKHVFWVVKRTISLRRFKREGSFEYPQYMFWLRNKKNYFQKCTLIWRPDTN